MDMTDGKETPPRRGLIAWENKFNIGNVIVILTMLATASASWVKLGWTIEDHEKRLTKQEALVKAGDEREGTWREWKGGIDEGMRQITRRLDSVIEHLRRRAEHGSPINTQLSERPDRP